MKFKLINRVTNEEHICDKVTIDEFDYYVSTGIISNYFYDIRLNRIIKSNNDIDGYKDYAFTFKGIVATNNSNIDIPKVTDEITEVFKNHFDIDSIDDFPKTVGDTNIIEYFKEGYNKSQQDFPFNEEDMIEFANWKYFNFFQRIRDVLYYTLSVRPMSKILDKDKGYTTKELLDIWKEQQIKILYYEV